MLCRAYSELSTTRAFTGMGIGPIPVTAMWQWCDRRQMPNHLTDYVVSVLRSVDAEAMRRSAERLRARTKGAS
jgi:hypothetical protein